MPVLDGFDVVELLGDDCPPVIFVTAYDEYAIKAFEVHAVDYLLKPVRKERLEESVKRVMQKRGSGSRPDALKKLLGESAPRNMNLLQKIPVNYKQEIRLIDHDQIFWFEADGKLTWVHITDQKRYRCDFSLSDLEERLTGTSFLRIHRSFIANMNQVEKLEPWFKGGYRITLKDGTELDVARRRVENLKERLGL
ncbi:MAG: response regulator transcription factor [Balneolaceae bacterium]|nr:response regulator transcription factor [Balneolaceae bacterium]